MSRFTYALKKSPLLRFTFFLLITIAVVFLLRALFSLFSPKPEITEVFPKTVKAGDTVTIAGKNFGLPDEARGLRFGDDFLSSASCVLWSDDKIRFVVPKNFATSLLAVSVGRAYSEPVILTNETEIPQPLTESILVAVPEIESLSRETGLIGQSVTIYGKNFGAVRQNSSVVFTENTADLADEDNTVLDGAFCNEAENDFVSWSDREIVVHVPDAAPSGSIVVQTAAGLSNFMPFSVSTRIGEKTLSNKRTILLSTEASVQDIKPRQKQNTLFLMVPQPIKSCMQKNILLQSSDGEPFARDFQGSNIYRFENLSEASKIRVAEKISMETYDVQVSVNAANVPVEPNLKPEVLRYTEAQPNIPSDKPEVVALAKKITYGNRNPYSNAKNVFNYLVENFKPEPLSVTNSPNVLTSLTTNSADVHELSLAYCALLRAVSVPCVQISGIVIDQNQVAHLHWWNEFYLEGVGWVPVDVGLALGAPFISGRKTNELFGNLDGLHVAFSRDTQLQTQMLSDSTLVTKAKSYSSRQIWEESSGLGAYNSLWSVPKVIAIY